MLARAEKRVGDLKELGFRDAGIYDPAGVGGTHVMYVLHHANDPNRYSGLPKDPRISPLRALDHLIRSFESDVVSMDYRVRGFTRDVDGVKHFIDHEINSIQDYIPDDIGNRYQMIDVNVLAERIFHTKMRLTELSLDDYLFAERAADLSEAEAETLTERIEGEVMEIFYGRNFPDE